MRFFLKQIILVLLFVAVLVCIIAFARGYRISPSQQSITSSGILVASSYPTGAKVYIDGDLKGATNTDIMMPPGDYKVEIKKDGYTSWEKDFKIKGELVIKADALLFPTNPSLSPITSIGVISAMNSPTGDKVLIVSESEEGVASTKSGLEDEEKNGIHILENTGSPFTRTTHLTQILRESTIIADVGDFALADIEAEFSPNEDQILITVFETDGIVSADAIISKPSTATDDKEISKIYLIDTTSLTKDPFDVTNSVDTIREAWAKERAQETEQVLETFKKPVYETAIQAFDIIAFSPDETKILYTATQSATLPLVIDPPLIASNQTPEERDLVSGKLYIYDKEEDKNFRLDIVDDSDSSEAGSSVGGSVEAGSNVGGSVLGDLARSTLLWHPDSMHIVIREEDAISVVDYDSSNRRTVYSGPFERGFVSVSKDGRLFILTNFTSAEGSLLDLYSVGLQ